MHQLYLVDPIIKTTHSIAPPLATIEIRFKYNQDFDSIYAMVPSTIAMMLALFPAILMALAVVRERELGSITQPLRHAGHPARIPDRQAIALRRGDAVMFALAVFFFRVPLAPPPTKIGSVPYRLPIRVTRMSSRTLGPQSRAIATGVSAAGYKFSAGPALRFSQAQSHDHRLGLPFRRLCRWKRFCLDTSGAPKASRPCEIRQARKPKFAVDCNRPVPTLAPDKAAPGGSIRR